MQEVTEVKYTKPEPARTIRDFVHDLYPYINCQPVGQRLPVYSKNQSKEQGIINTLLEGLDIGTITTMELNADEEYHEESVDGGHRKRAIWNYYSNQFKVNDKLYKQLSDDDKERFLDIELSFTVYKELESQDKGHIFRTLNKTTDVNFIEMLNSYGDIAIANSIRETSRLVKDINNSYHDLFEYKLSNKTQKPLYRFLNFDNDRLKHDHMVARLFHRYMTSPKKLLGGSADIELQEMYESDFEEKNIISVQKKVNTHLDFLRTMSDHKKSSDKSGNGLTQHEFKAMSYLYFWIQDNYPSFTKLDTLRLYNRFDIANTLLASPEGKHSKVIHKKSGYSVQIMYKKYIAAPWDGGKIKTAINYLVKEINNIEDCFLVTDSKRGFSHGDRKLKLAEQGGVCAIDGKPLKLMDAHAAHIVAHSEGGQTNLENMVMVRAIHNTRMGTMNVNDYRESLMAVV